MQVNHHSWSDNSGDSVTTIVDMNGSSDYIELYGRQDSGSTRRIKRCRKFTL